MKERGLNKHRVSVRVMLKIRRRIKARPRVHPRLYGAQGHGGKARPRVHPRLQLGLACLLVCTLQESSGEQGLHEVRCMR